MTTYLSSHNKLYSEQEGFSLIEMAIVLVILGMLLGGLLMPLSSQRELSQRQATERQLQEIRNALIGFAQANGRLPCPAPSGPLPVTQRGLEVPCAAANNRVPYATLGIQGVLFNDDLVDAWQRPLIYRVDAGFAATITNAPAVTPILTICSGMPCPNALTTITTTAVAVVLSLGDNSAFTSPAETLNSTLGTDRFVTDTPKQNFNDILIWIPHATLIYEFNKTR